MTSTAPGHASAEGDEPTERRAVLWLVVGGLAAVSAVIAALVIFSSGGGPAQDPEAPAAVAAAEHSVRVGDEGAPVEVVVYQDFADPASRAFDIASRDFLRIEAAQGRVLVDYRPIAPEGGYAQEAWAAWSAVLGSGTPEQALAFHDTLLDQQPAAQDGAAVDLAARAEEAGIDDPGLLNALGAADPTGLESANRRAAEAGAGEVPTVLLDGEPVEAGSPVEVADTLQRRLLELAD